MAIVSTIAGTWYPSSVQEIRAVADDWEKCAIRDEAKPPANPNLLVLPHAGWAYSGSVAWRAVRCVRGAKFRRVVILAPSHRAWIENRLIAPSSDSVSTPLGEIKIDGEWLDRLALVAPVAKNDSIHLAEHSAQIEYPLLQLALGDTFSIVPLVMGGFGKEQMEMCARALARLMDKETLLVVSSDFTHYGDDFSYTPYGKNGGEDVRLRVAEVDSKAFSFPVKHDADGFVDFVRSTGATICGRIPLEMAVRAFSDGASMVRLMYSTSGDAERDYSRFVCYLAAAGHVEWGGVQDEVLDAETRTFLLRVARESLSYGIRTGKPLARWAIAKEVPKAALLKMGAFVTLKDRMTGALRGCIGEIMPRRPLVEAVAARAVDSALHDPRFMPVTESELGGLRIEVSALTPPKKVKSWREIVLGRDGMTLEKGSAFAVFLPQVAPEQGWDIATTLSHLSMKAGLPADAWREGATFETFQAEVFHE